MAVAESTHDQHDHHEHGEFIAHHFDTPEQQFDSGKLGIWAFLVTEVLFFSGLFVSYILWRNHHPEIFEQAHVFLDKYLGALNTVVLLFSSLTIAWGVRSAQLGNNRMTAILTLITMVCASMFLGVKAIEYSHKWDMGILVRSHWAYTMEHFPTTMPLAKSLGLSGYLVGLSIVPAILGGLFLVTAAIMKLQGKDIWFKFFLGQLVMISGYFMGAVGGYYYMEAKEQALEKSHSQKHLVAADRPVVLTQEQEHAVPAQEAAKSAGVEPAAQHDHQQTADQKAEQHGQTTDHEEHSEHAVDPHLPKPQDLDRDVGIFFSIYYCMTGLHAIHIIGGIIALSWIFYRSLAGHWRPDYFGPVDYVGLYWHLVDLIWIYLFPMLYLID